jgi:hypothetical protein
MRWLLTEILPETGKFFAALAVTRIISVEDMSLHITPLYLDEAIDVFHTTSEERDEDEEDMLNGHELPASKLQPEVGSEEFIYQSKVDLLKSQALAAKEMQDICKAVGELIAWRLMEDIVSAQAYVTAPF